MARAAGTALRLVRAGTAPTFGRVTDLEAKIPKVSTEPTKPAVWARKV